MKRIEKLARAIKDGKEIGPETVMISPTDRCNLKCKTCWRMDKDQEKFERGLPFSKIKEILQDCKELDVSRIDFTGGGEPFLRDGIFDIIETAKDFDFEVSLTTNGTLLTEKKIKKLIDIGLDEILFSIDGPRETNNYLRGEGTFEKIIRNAKFYNTLKEEAMVGFSSVISKENYGELIEVVKIAEDLDLDYVNFTVMNVWESNEDFKLQRDDYGKITSELEEIRNFQNKNSVDTNIGKILKHGIFEREPPKFCFAPWEMAFINASGEVMACCTLASYYKNLLGNVKDQEFIQIWRGEKMEKFREEMRNKNFHPKCRECLPDFIEKYNNLYEEMKDNDLGIN